MAHNEVLFRVMPGVDVAKLRRLLTDLVVGERPTDVKAGRMVRLRRGRLLDERSARLAEIGQFQAAKLVPGRPAADERPVRPKRRAPSPVRNGLMATTIGPRGSRGSLPPPATRVPGQGPRLGFRFFPGTDAATVARARGYLRPVACNQADLDQLDPQRVVPVQPGPQLRELASHLGQFGHLLPLTGAA